MNLEQNELDYFYQLLKEDIYDLSQKLLVAEVKDGKHLQPFSVNQTLLNLSYAVKVFQRVLEGVK